MVKKQIPFEMKSLGYVNARFCPIPTFLKKGKDKEKGCEDWNPNFVFYYAFEFVI